MANRNLADEVDALAKGLASLRARISGLSRRVAALEDRQLQKLIMPAAKELADIDRKNRAAIKPGLTWSPSGFWYLLRAWWAR